MARWALAWCLRHPAVSCVVAGCKSVERLESNAGRPTSTGTTIPWQWVVPSQGIWTTVDGRP
jgi:hypothetical protein